MLRLQSSVKSSYLILLVEELEEAIKSFSVTVVLLHEHLDPSSVVVATLPNRDVSWALCELQTLGYCGPPEPSYELSMKEGEQLLLQFSGYNLQWYITNLVFIPLNQVSRLGHQVLEY